MLERVASTYKNGGVQLSTKGKEATLWTSSEIPIFKYIVTFVTLVTFVTRYQKKYNIFSLCFGH